jgi:hypothetical protein
MCIPNPERVPSPQAHMMQSKNMTIGDIPLIGRMDTSGILP